MEKEVQRNKMSFPNIDFSIEAIIDRTIINPIHKNPITEIKHDSYSSENDSKDEDSKEMKHENTIEGFYSAAENKGFFYGTNAEYNSTVNKLIAINSCKFLVISNIFIYDFEYIYNSNVLVLRRKINLVAIDFFSITADFKKLIIHVNSLLDTSGNIFIATDNSIHIVFCLCNILFYCYSLIKTLIVVPKSQSFFDKIKNTFQYDKIKEIYNFYVDEVYRKIGELIPYDKDEEAVKLIPLSKIESKFTDTKIDKLLLITNKKILELSSDIVEKASKINIIPLSKIKKINEFSKSHKFQIVLDDGATHQYSSLHFKSLIQLIKYEQSKDCLLELEIIKID